MRKAEFIPAAREEFLADVAFYQSIQPRLGEKFSLAVQNALGLALAFPMAGSPGSSGTRRVGIKGFPFWLVYKNHQTTTSLSSQWLISRANPDTGVTASP